MKYRVKVKESNFKMSSEQSEKILKVLRTWYREGVPESEKVDLSFVMKTSSIVDVFDKFGYYLNTIIDDSDQVWYEFAYMSHLKLGSELAIFNKIAPCLDDGLYFHYYNEDGENFRYYFKNGKCIEQIAKIIFDEI